MLNLLQYHTSMLAQLSIDNTKRPNQISYLINRMYRIFTSDLQQSENRKCTIPKLRRYLGKGTGDCNAATILEAAMPHRE